MTRSKLLEDAPAEPRGAYSQVDTVRLVELLSKGKRIFETVQEVRPGEANLENADSPPPTQKKNVSKVRLSP